MGTDNKGKVTSVQTITVLGSTGSIGVSTLDVLSRHPEHFSVFALTADTNVDVLAQQCRHFQPHYAVMRDSVSADLLRQEIKRFDSSTEVLSGEQALVDVARAVEVDTVMAAIVGAAGLLPTLAAVKAGKKVLLANKESLVMAGQLFMDAVISNGAKLLPIDSEHNAIFQCLPVSARSGNVTTLKDDTKKAIRKILLTGSGGPFRTWSAEAISQATPEQACKHPNWSMGQKISVDSASLMNKGLEFIEARWLFDVSPADIQVVIHPQSIVHSMVEYVDGSVLAQLGQPDMRTPIAHALAWPDRVESGVHSLDWFTMTQLEFEKPDFNRFPALALAIEAASVGSGAAATLNAANEVAVASFLERQIGFSDIGNILEEVMATVNFVEPDSIDAVLHVDSLARQSAQKFIKSASAKKTA